MATISGHAASVVGASGSGVATTMRPPCLAQDAIVLPRVQHDLAKNLEMFLLNFDLDNKEETPENFVNRLMLSLLLQNLKQENVVCRLFPYTFQGKAPAWYFSLPQGSITNWKQFEIVCMTKFDEDETPSTLLMKI